MISFDQKDMRDIGVSDEFCLREKLLMEGFVSFFSFSLFFRIIYYHR